MKSKLVIAVAGLSCLLGSISLAVAQSEVEAEITQWLVEDNAYTLENLKGRGDSYSRDGALEFWSSGGLLHEVENTGRPEAFDSYNIRLKHIHVIPIAGGEAAVAHYYSEGSMKPKGSAAVSHYLTRVTQVFVKENGEWKVRSSHWSPVSGGSGTSQSALE